jgi:hypothetical protein
MRFVRASICPMEKNWWIWICSPPSPWWIEIVNLVSDLPFVKKKKKKMYSNYNNDYFRIQSLLHFSSKTKKFTSIKSHSSSSSSSSAFQNNFKSAPQFPFEKNKKLLGFGFLLNFQWQNYSIFNNYEELTEHWFVLCTMVPICRC